MNRVIKVFSELSYPEGVLFQRSVEGEVTYHAFTGKDIPDVCKVLSITDSKSRIWQRTWIVEYSENTRVFMTYKHASVITHDPNIPPRKDNFSDEIKVVVPSLKTTSKWAEVPKNLHEVVRSLYPKIASRLDENEKPV